MKNHNLPPQFSNLSESALYDSQNLEEEYIFSFPAFSCITLKHQIRSESVDYLLLSKISDTHTKSTVFSFEQNTENRIQTLTPHLCPMGS